MKEVFIYVEGPSDKLGLEVLLSSYLQTTIHRNNYLYIIPMNGKEPLLNKGPIKATNILRNRKNSYVFIVPDLYPQNKPFPHTTYEELKIELMNRFKQELLKKNMNNRISNRFYIHCFKYDLEVLLLASYEIMLQRIGLEKIKRTWKIPVENQNFNKPPKKVIEQIFLNCNKKYKDTADVPWILARTDLNMLQEKCPQNFAPFIEDLFSIIS